MKDKKSKLNHEVSRILRVSDMLCTMHSILKDKYSKKAFNLDIGVLFCSVWICSTTFLDTTIAKQYKIIGIELGTLLGFLSVVVFFMTIFQFVINWKGRAESHSRALEIYTQIKLDCLRLRHKVKVEIQDEENVIEKYQKIGALLIKIPDDQFVNLKRKHQIKVLKSRILDRNPGVIPFILHVIIICRGTLKAFNANNEELLNGQK